jgi:hypothetical protein
VNVEVAPIIIRARSTIKVDPIISHRSILSRILAAISGSDMGLQINAALFQKRLTNCDGDQDCSDRY